MTDKPDIRDMMLNARSNPFLFNQPMTDEQKARYNKFHLDQMQNSQNVNQFDTNAWRSDIAAMNAWEKENQEARARFVFLVVGIIVGFLVGWAV